MTSDFWRNRLGKRMVSLMILSSAILSILAAGTQLYFTYDHDRTQALNSFTVVEDSFLRGLESALWEYNTSQVSVLLNGILAQKDVAALRLETAENQSWDLGDREEPGLIHRSFPLSFESADNHHEPLGTLRVGLSLDLVKARLWTQFWTLLMSNFVKAMIAALLMLIIFDALAARHLRKILHQTNTGWMSGTAPMRLDRPPHRDRDELDDIVTALNTARDSTRQAQQDLAWKLEETRDLNARLEEAGREQSAFTFAISHDLKSPANTILMLSDELREILGDDPEPEAADVLSDIEKTSRRMVQLIEDILIYSRTTGEELAIEAVDLNQETDEILRDISGDISRAGARIDVIDLPVIPGNRVQLRMLLQNLISNGIKFRAPDRAPKIEVTSTDDPETDAVRISVRDNGIGISKDHFDKIFGLFERLHTSAEYQGSGIGLAVCQRIAANHGGTLEIASVEGVGSTFTAILPGIARGKAMGPARAAQ